MDYLIDNDVFFAAIVSGHARHEKARAWLNSAKAGGWGIAIETYLCALRLLTNTSAMNGNPRTTQQAFDAVDRELAGNHPGKIVYAQDPPRRAIIGRAHGTKQIMDFWLVQLARQEDCKLATSDNGTHANWPAETLLV